MFEFGYGGPAVRPIVPTGFFVAPWATGRVTIHGRDGDVGECREESMESHHPTTVHLESDRAPILQPTRHRFRGHVRDHVPEHRHPAGPIDLSHRLGLGTALRVIAAMMFLRFALWWDLT